MRLVLLIICFLTINCSYATIYVQEDENSITYSDTPFSHESKPLEELPTPNTTSSIVTPTAPVANSQAAPNTVLNVSIPSDTPSVPAVTVGNEKANANPVPAVPVVPTGPVVTSYRTFLIITPQDQENIQNQVTIPVEVKLEPNLQSGNKVMLVLDGKPQGVGVASTHLTLGNVERGQHTLSAVIVDSNNQVLSRSNSVTIYWHRSSVQMPRPNGSATTSNTTTTPGWLTQVMRFFL
jgi:hypothetical protein